MIFSSYAFLLSFLPLSWVGFMVLRYAFKDSLYRSTVLLLWLLGSSVWFYAQWFLPDLWVLLGVVAVNFAAVAATSRQAHRQALPIILFANLGVLALFKYWPWLGGNADRAVLLAGLPLGISFYIFQVMAFQVDLSRGHTLRPRFLDFAVFLSFFPQLIAGPIVHGRKLLPQLAKLGGHPCCVGLGVTLLTLGLAKKVLIADTLAGGVDAVYAGQHSLDAVTVLAAAFGYGTQLYFDFSGYADMAVGLGLLFGIRLPQNFRRPYTAHSLAEFWRRWHITLSSFLRDYLYISLGGNRLGAVRRSANLLITMTLGGLWHGAGWQFLVWGAAHGGLLAAEHALKNVMPSAVRLMPRAVMVALTVSTVMLLWLPFRATDVEHAFTLMAALTQWSAVAPPDLSDLMVPLRLMSSTASSPVVVLLWSIGLLICAGLRPTSWRWALSAATWQRGAVSGLLLVMVLKTLADRPDQPFLYFQF